MSPGGTRLHGPAWLSGGLHLFILAGAAQSERPEVWPWALFAMATVSFFAWMANYRRYRQIHDLPTSRVASAAQGWPASNFAAASKRTRLAAHSCA